MSEDQHGRGVADLISFWQEKSGVMNRTLHSQNQGQVKVKIEENTSDGEQILLATDNDLKQTKTADYEDVDGDARDGVVARDISKKMQLTGTLGALMQLQQKERQRQAQLPGEDQADEPTGWNKTADYGDVDGDARDRVATRDNSKEPQLAPHVDVQTQMQRTERQLHARLPGDQSEEQQPGGAGAANAGRPTPELPLLQLCFYGPDLPTQQTLSGAAPDELAHPDHLPGQHRSTEQLDAVIFDRLGVEDSRGGDGSAAGHPGTDTAVGGLEIVQDFEDSGAPNGVSGRKLADQIAQGKEHPPTRGTETNDIGLDGLRRADGSRTPHDVHSDRNLTAGELASTGCRLLACLSPTPPARLNLVGPGPGTSRCSLRRLGCRISTSSSGRRVSRTSPGETLPLRNSLLAA